MSFAGLRKIYNNGIYIYMCVCVSVYVCVRVCMLKLILYVWEVYIILRTYILLWLYRYACRLS